MQVSDDGIRIPKERDRCAGNVPYSPETVPDDVGPRGSDDISLPIAVDDIHHASSPAHICVGTHVDDGGGMNWLKKE